MGVRQGLGHSGGGAPTVGAPGCGKGSGQVQRTPLKVPD